MFDEIQENTTISNILLYERYNVPNSTNSKSAFFKQLNRCFIIDRGRYETKIILRRAVILPMEHGNKIARKGKRSNNFAKTRYIKNLHEDDVLAMNGYKNYVYLHFLDGKLVYIGKGKNHRMTSDTRVPRHQYLIKQGLIETMILRTFDSEDMALAYERKCIDFFREKGYNLFNVQ
ncbi:GIY-YIG nuclease family protein [Clostridium perfringens]|uniref:hypothetical protein n=1 Tax=Clostridium perfringens TaxID=1502 RepID=UPI001ABAA086|nr:hypothetical protein [Clostridium perfringens]MBO3339855.1 hypothetical protein [Clostridium perfringens]MDK0581876.1 hypothetical protein [Clostridium perfringens]MDK0842848.1 hypothetical protein [Clostridium perfringens]MDM0696508.1 hypothetical protein [Clostridium perfringens]MDM1008170.1 hypothetical protein [Clostridium perfringens]